MLRPRQALAALLLLLCPGRADAYEFEVNSQTQAQGDTLHAMRLMGLRLGRSGERMIRRRISQSIQLHLWDLAGTRQGLSLFDPEPARGPKVYFSSYFRFNNDFGSYSEAELLIDGELRDALDVVPELERNVLQFDLLFGYVGVEGLADGKVDVFVGRQMEVQTLDWFSMDGLKVRAHLPASLLVEAFAGARVHENSWIATEAMTPDGTSSALCEEYVEGAMPGSGAWRPIDGLPVAEGSVFTSDDELCPQREQWMPTWGAAIASEGLESVIARVSYRQTRSPSAGILGEPGRLDFEDLGYYPNEAGQAPGWGTNEERFAASLRVPIRRASGLQLVPYAAARYSLLHGLLDEAHGGLRVAQKAHSLETELFYSVPTFEGDSIFNVFSSEPYSDVRTTWQYRPTGAAWGSYSKAWGRRYHSEDSEASGQSSNEYAGGVQVGADYRWGLQRRVRVDGFHEDGYGGQRSGAYVSSLWRWSPSTVFRTRFSVIRFDEDLRSELRGTNLGAQVGTTYQINKGVAASLMVEHNSNHIDRFQLGAFALVDLAFQPET